MDDAEVHGAHFIGIVVDHAEYALGAASVNDELLADFTLHAGQIGGNVVMAGLAVHRIDVAAYADGALVMQPGLSPRTATGVVQDAALVAEDGIGDDLLVGRIVLRGFPVHEGGYSRLHERVQIMFPALAVSLEITGFLKDGAGNHQYLFSIVT